MRPPRVSVRQDLSMLEIYRMGFSSTEPGYLLGCEERLPEGALEYQVTHGSPNVENTQLFIGQILKGLSGRV